MDPGIPFSAFLAYTEAEHARWKQFFAEHPEALDLPCDVAGSGTIRELLFHIFAVNLFFGHRVLGLDKPDFKTIPHASVEELFAVDTQAFERLREFLQRAPAEEWDEKLPLWSLDRQASKRKMFAQALLHGVHHRAQLATSLRQQGLKQDWIHDWILSDAVE